MSRPLTFSTREILERNGLTYAGELDPGAFQDSGLAGELAAGGSVELEFSVGGSRILMSGRLRGGWSLECARCLERFEAPIDSSFEEIFPQSLASIDVSEELRQALVLAAPAKPLCRPDCKGLCPSCGRNLNEGPCGCPQGGPPARRLQDRR